MIKPVLQALVIADRVYTDKDTNKKIIAGTFDRILFKRNVKPIERELPDGRRIQLSPGGMQAGSPWVYICFTDVCDGTKITLRFTNLTKNKPLFFTALGFSGTERLGSTEVILPLPPLPIVEPGTYAIEIWCDDELLGMRRLVAEELPDRTDEVT